MSTKRRRCDRKTPEQQTKRSKRTNITDYATVHTIGRASRSVSTKEQLLPVVAEVFQQVPLELQQIIVDYASKPTHKQVNVICTLSLIDAIVKSCNEKNK